MSLFAFPGVGRHVDHPLTVGQQPLRQRPAGAVAALHRPDPLRPSRDVLTHRRVAGLIGAVPAGRQHAFPIVDHLNRRRQLVGIHPDKHLHPRTASTCRSHASHGDRRERKPKKSHTRKPVGSRKESTPPDA
jgi:hypothetical protein